MHMRASEPVWHFGSLHDTVFAAVMIECNGTVGFKIEFGFPPNLFGNAPSFASGSQ